MLCECEGWLLVFLASQRVNFSLPRRRADLGLAQEEGRQRILFCRKLGQQVFIIMLDSPMWFAFRNELGWHCVWLISSSQKAGLKHCSIYYGFPKLNAREYLDEEAQAVVCSLGRFLELSVRSASGPQNEVQDILERGDNRARIFSVTEVDQNHIDLLWFYTPWLMIVPIACSIVSVLFGCGQILILVLPKYIWVIPLLSLKLLLHVAEISVLSQCYLGSENKCVSSLPLPVEDQIVANIIHVGEFRLPFFADYFDFTE